jgi:hypothetical protein
MSNTFKSEIGHIIHDNLGKELRDKYGKLDANTKESLRKLDMKKLEAYFNQPSKHVAVQNKWIKRTALAITVVLMIMVTMLFVTLKYSCQTCIPFMEIIKENLIVFAFVGAVEYFFFTKIAMKFIPAPPSLMVRTFVESVQKEFSK